MTSEPATYSGYRFPAVPIGHAVFLCHFFGLILRELELTLAERAIVVTHDSVCHWCTKFGGRPRPQPPPAAEAG
ncbi:MAG: hypothetical protein M3Q65_08845 [Chloroflexota bacterium]|nr:hypothetical protein [Chloroflexota bacterium]